MRLVKIIGLSGLRGTVSLPPEHPETSRRQATAQTNHALAPLQMLATIFKANLPCRFPQEHAVKGTAPADLTILLLRP